MRAIAKCHSAENYIQEPDAQALSSLILPKSIPFVLRKSMMSGTFSGIGRNADES